MPDALSAISTRNVPQSQPLNERQALNNAGGYAFTLDDEARLRRFLVLGTEGGTYYVGQGDLTKDNADVVMRMAKAQPRRTVDVIEEISVAGRAPKQNQALFALAVVASQAPTAEDRRYALAALPKVARTGTHLFQFTGYIEQFRGWGRGLRRAVADWYTSKEVDDLAYQMVKYRQREGWSHRDLLRLSHPVTSVHERQALFDWACGREPFDKVPDLVTAFEEAQEAPVNRLPALIADSALSWEMLPTEALRSAEVWEALLDKGMPQTALLRNLPRLTNLGVLSGERLGKVVAQITDPERLRKARVHPVNVLIAQRTYASGYSMRGDGSWTPKRQVVDALDAAFYAAFGVVQPSGKRHLIGLDVSGSTGVQISGLPLTVREASAAMALVTIATEPDTEVVGFTGAGRDFGYGWHDAAIRQDPDESLSVLSISPRQRLDDVLRSIANLPFGATDCALPILYAAKHGLEIDTFVTYTDNESWVGKIHVAEALRRYRDTTGIPARHIVVGMTATEFTVNDPTDPLGLDVAGFDSAVPTLIADFSRGAI